MKPLNTTPSRRRSAVMLSSTLISLPSRRSASISMRRPRIRTFAGAQKALQAGAVSGAVKLRDDQLAEVSPSASLARPAEDVFRLRIPVRDDAALVHLDKGVERGIDDAARQLFAFAQGFLRQPAFGHVAADEEMPA